MLIALARPALAFDEATQFFAPGGVAHPATLGASGEGIYFTGAPRYSNLDCSSCHTDGPRHVGLTLGADDPTLFSTGYEPGRTYELAVSITHETEGLQYATPTCTEVPSSPGDFSYVQCNHNNFALEVDDASLLPLVGTDVFCAAPSDSGCPKPDPSADEIVVAPGGDAVFANRAHSMSMPYQLLHNDMTEWHLWWTAPQAGTGPLTFYAAAVDGNGGGGTVDDDQDPFSDDTVRAAITVKEIGGPGRAPSTSGCSVTDHGSPGVLAIGFVLALVVRLRRRHLLAAFVALAACSGNGPEMQPGSDCLRCHSPGGGAHAYTVAGTVYANQIAFNQGLVDATVHVVDANGATMDLVTNAAGNYYTDADVVFPISVSVGRGDVSRTMEPTVTNGSCNYCHALPPRQGAFGPVSIPSPPP